ncbi:MAG: FUSC family protein [bacterium]
MTQASDPASDPGTRRRLAKALRSTDDPLSFRMVGALAAGGAVAAVLAILAGSPMTPLAILVGGYLGAVALTGPLALTLRLMILFGGLAVVTISLAVVSAGVPLAQAAILAVLAYLGAVWSAIPYIGPLGGGFMPMMYLLLTFVFTADSLKHAVWQAPVAGLIGVVAATLVALVIHARDPWGTARRDVAQQWTEAGTLDGSARTAAMLQLSGRPSVLTDLLRAAVLAMLGRATVRPGTDDSLVDAASTASDDIAGTLQPRGRLVPRDVPGEPLHAPAERLRIGISRWAEAIDRARGLLAGRTVPPRPSRLGPSLAETVWGSAFRPSDIQWRYGAQRAIALGGGAAVLAITGLPHALWVLITMFAVLQPDAPVTFVKAGQRGAGTLAGALLAIALSLVLPSSVLYPWLAILAMLVGLLWMRRNYAVMTACVAAAVVFFSGVPSGTAPAVAGMRLLDTVVGVAVGWLISALVFPVRARPLERRANALDAIDRFLGSAGGPAPDRETFIAQLQPATRALADYRASVRLIHEGATPSQESVAADVTQVESLLREVTMLGVLEGEDPDDPLLDKAHERLAHRAEDLRADPPT